jgi:hypothetical protein
MRELDKMAGLYLILMLLAALTFPIWGPARAWRRWRTRRSR